MAANQNLSPVAAISNTQADAAPRAAVQARQTTDIATALVAQVRACYPNASWITLESAQDSLRVRAARDIYTRDGTFLTTATPVGKPAVISGQPVSQPPAPVEAHGPMI
jgi:hypothetical protein